MNSLMKWIESTDNITSLGSIRFSIDYPRILLIDNFLSNDEIENFIKTGNERFTSSTVVNNQTGERYTMNGRISDSAHYRLSEFEWLKNIESKIEELTGLPVKNGEPFQIQRYNQNGLYNPHYDWFNKDQPGSAQHLKTGGQRVATVILYLQDPILGGSTYFPSLRLRIRPNRGTALYFQNVDAEMNPVKESLHGGDIVISGTKYIATKWIRESTYA